MRPLSLPLGLGVSSPTLEKRGSASAPKETPTFMTTVPAGTHTLMLEKLTNGTKRTKAIDLVVRQKNKVDEIWE